MYNKFQRNYQLDVVGNDGKLHSFKYPLTLNFNIKRDILASSNTGSFKIYNLGQSTRNAIYKDQFLQNLSFRSLILKAGYGVVDPSTLPIIFQGNVMQAQSYRLEKEVNFITEIEGYDYGWVLTNAKSTLSFPANTVLKSFIIKSLIKDLQSTVPKDPTNPNIALGIGAISPQFDPLGSDGKPMNYQQAFSCCDNTWDILQGLTGNQSYIDNGNVFCLFENDVFTGPLTLINSQTGLLGTPKKRDRSIIVEVLFEPRLQVGQQINIDSKALIPYTNANNGTFKIVGLEHHGIISGAVGGECKTIVSCLLPVNPFNPVKAST